MQSVLSPCKIDFTVNNGLCIYVGSSWTVPVSVVSRENSVDTPCDLTGYTAEALIKRNIDDEVSVAKPTVTIDEEDHSKFVIFLPSAQTQLIPTQARDSFGDYSDYFYEVRFTDTVSGEQVRALYGVVQVVAAVIDENDNEE